MPYRGQGETVPASIRISKQPNPKQMLLQACWARSFWDRMRGLIARPALQAGGAMLISPCSSVHTVGMQYPLDLVFLNASGHAVKLVSGIPPYRVAACPGASHVLEMPAGSIETFQIKPGETFNWQYVSD
jgi:uncharacterized membrane protein (UPF0127 family)